MKQEDSQHELVMTHFSQFLDQELSGEKQERFEAHLAVCERCQRILADQKHADDLIHQYRRTKLRHLSTDQLIAFHADCMDSTWQKEAAKSHLSSCDECQRLLRVLENLSEIDVEKNDGLARIVALPTRDAGTWLSRKIISLAAAILAGLLFLLFQPPSDPDTHLVRITPAPYLSSALRGGEDDALAAFTRGMEHYMNRDFASAVPLLKRAADLAPGNAQRQFFCGVTLLLNEDYATGLDYLTRDSVLESAYADEMRWYAALACLRLGQEERAREFLRQLLNSSGELSVRARNVLPLLDDKEKNP